MWPFSDIDALHEMGFEDHPPEPVHRRPQQEAGEICGLERLFFYQQDPDGWADQVREFA